MKRKHRNQRRTKIGTFVRLRVWTKRTILITRPERLSTRKTRAMLNQNRERRIPSRSRYSRNIYESGICFSIFEGIETADTVLNALTVGLFDTTKSQPDEETSLGRLMVCETQGRYSS